MSVDTPFSPTYLLVLLGSFHTSSSLSHGQQMQVNHYVFVKKYDGGDFLILMLYVDDMLIVGQDPKKFGSLKRALSKSFAMKDMGPAKQILGMHIVRD